jgi:SAM-dependent methyltransferase
MESAHYEQAELWGEDHVFDPANQVPKFEAVQQLLPNPAPTALVDVGAGDGRLLDHLHRHGFDGRTTAAERSRTAIGIVDLTSARVQASVDALPFAARSFPVVVCCEVLEHLPPDIYGEARAELSRIAADYVIITVPNREKRSRSDISCEVCGCRYNPDRHLRSFTRDDLTDLLPGFGVDTVIETGPRQPVYPRWARLLLERANLLVRPGAPTCPQCGASYRYASGGTPSAERSATDASSDGGRRSYDLARRFVPKARHPYYLCARFRRR